MLHEDEQRKIPQCDWLCAESITFTLHVGQNDLPV
eukprot:SAG31_NODE_9187_length_1319_cov_1.853279_1_plen_34_part_10